MEKALNTASQCDVRHRTLQTSALATHFKKPLRAFFVYAF